MEKNKGKVIATLIFFAIVIVGGYILMVTLKFDDNDNKELVSEVTKDIRLDPSKDYIYFEDPYDSIEELDIDYQKIVINFENDIDDKINSEVESLSKTVTYDDTLADDMYDNLSYARYLNYEVIYYKDYISLIVRYYHFKADTLISYESSVSYVFDKNTGKLLSEDDLLNKFDLTKDDALTKIKDYIDGEDLLKDDEDLDGSASVSNIDTLALYIDKIGRLYASVLVKSNQKDYNENILLT